MLARTEEQAATVLCIARTNMLHADRPDGLTRATTARGGDTEVYGAQQHAPPPEIKIPKRQGF